LTGLFFCADWDELLSPAASLSASPPANALLRPAQAPMSPCENQTEYRIMLRRVGSSEKDFAAQFTAIVTAKDAEDVVGEAEKLVGLLGGQFSVVEILPGHRDRPA
jgi:hypothetical protein